MGEGEVTLGELARRLDVMHTDLRDLRSAVVERPDLEAVANSWHLLITTNEAAADARLKAHEREVEVALTQIRARLDSVESWGIWTVRVILGIVITAVLALVLVQSGVIPSR